MSSSVSVLFHTSFPSPTLGWKPSSPGDLLCVSFFQVSLLLEGCHASIFRAPAGEHPASKHQCVIKSFKKAKGLGKDLAVRPLAVALEAEGNRGSCYFFCFSDSPGSGA